MSRRNEIMQAYDPRPGKSASLHQTRTSSLYKTSIFPPLMGPADHRNITTRSEHAHINTDKRKKKANSRVRHSSPSPYDTHSRQHHVLRKPFRNGGKTRVSKTKKTWRSQDDATTPKLHPTSVPTSTENPRRRNDNGNKKSEASPKKKNISKSHAGQLSSKRGHDEDPANKVQMSRNSSGADSSSTDNASTSRSNGSGHTRRKASSRDRILQQTITKAYDEYLGRADNGAIQTEFVRLRTLLDRNVRDEPRLADDAQKQQGRIGEILSECRRHTEGRSAMPSIHTRLSQMYGPSSGMADRGGNSCTETAFGRRCGLLPPLDHDVQSELDARLDHKMEYLLSRYNAWEA